MVSEKNVYKVVFSMMSLETLDHQVGTSSDPRGLICRTLEIAAFKY